MSFKETNNFILEIKELLSPDNCCTLQMCLGNLIDDKNLLQKLRKLMNKENDYILDLKNMECIEFTWKNLINVADDILCLENKKLGIENEEKLRDEFLTYLCATIINSFIFNLKKDNIDLNFPKKSYTLPEAIKNVFPLMKTFFDDEKIKLQKDYMGKSLVTGNISHTHDKFIHITKVFLTTILRIDNKKIRNVWRTYSVKNK